MREGGASSAAGPWRGLQATLPGRCRAQQPWGPGQEIRVTGGVPSLRSTAPQATSRGALRFDNAVTLVVGPSNSSSTHYIHFW